MEKMNYAEKLSYGIDLGIASVGWSVLDIENNKIIDKGVYLFSEADKAEERRNARSVRRRKRRKIHRIERLEKLFTSIGIEEKNTDDNKLLEKRLKGIKGKIEKQDIINIIMFMARHRGYIPFKDEDERTSQIVDKLRENGYIACEMQNEIFKTNNCYRGDEYLVQHIDYMKELDILLKEQSKYYPVLTEKVNTQIKEIINSKRKFWEGPGGPRENQLSKYGRYKTLEDLEKYKKDKNYNKYLFEELIGKCSVYSNEKKASAYNFYAECFNFYNDIVNLRIDIQELDETNRVYFEKVNNKLYKLTGESIQKLKDEVLNSKSVSYSKLFKNLFNVDFVNIFGYKKDLEENAKIAKFEQIRKIKNKLDDEKKVNELLRNMEAYNTAIYLIQVSPDSTTRYEMLSDKLKNIYSEDLIHELSTFNIENRYHSFSEKALKEYLMLMEEYNENSSYIERNYADIIKSDVEEELLRNYIKENVEEGELKYINSKYVDDIVASPATKKAIRKAISVLNRLFSKYGYPKYICIENTRELLPDAKQKEYDSLTLENEQKRKHAANKLNEAGFEVTDNNINKQLLLNETNFKCAYCNKEITVGNCEIEHILPRSIVFDDSFANKTVACTQCNSEKKNRTPYEFLSVKNLYKEFKERTIKNKEFIEKKKNNLLFEQDINKYEKIFKNRNLNDTAYATNELANQVNMFKKAYTMHNYGEIIDSKILRVPGQFTGIIRNKSGLEKDRNLKYHHAVDATIVASIPMCKIGKLMNMIQNEPDKYWKIDNLQDYRENLYNDLYLRKSIKEELIKADYSNTRFAQETVKKTNAQLFDANIFKVIIKDDDYYKIEQINNIYEILPKNIENTFMGKHFLCQDNDKELYNKIMKILDMYPGKKVNPFVEYCKENNIKEDEKFNYKKHGIRKNDNPNSAIVVRLRYLTKVNNPFLMKNDKLVISEKKGKSAPMVMYDSLKQYCTRIYRDKENGKLFFMPILRIFVDNKSGEIKTDSDYYKLVYDAYVNKNENDVEKYMDLFNNEYVRFKDSKGVEAEGLVSCFDKTNKKIKIKNVTNNITAKTVEIKKIKFDVLGLYNLNI